MEKHVLTIVSFVLMFHYQAFAQVKDAGKVANEFLKARPLDLGSVRLLGGPLKQAQDLDAKYLLELEPDRMLAYYRQRADYIVKELKEVQDKHGDGSIDTNLVKGKKKVTVKFESTEKNVVAAIFGIRMILADTER